MKSALECFRHATRCEEMAHASNDDINRRMLLATAEIWRALGERSKSAEADAARSHHARTSLG
jgi:hypothetical protein